MVYNLTVRDELEKVLDISLSACMFCQYISNSRSSCYKIVFGQRVVWRCVWGVCGLLIYIFLFLTIRYQCRRLTFFDKNYGMLMWVGWVDEAFHYQGNAKPESSVFSASFVQTAHPLHTFLCLISCSFSVSLLFTSYNF
jgi:hypothetical protein